MYKLDNLFDEVLKSRGGLRKGHPADRADYVKVWDAFNRYLTVTHQKRQTLNVHNFCKIGWRIEEFQGKPRLRPHFQLADSFMRVFNIEAKAHQCISDRYLAQAEEFNFSKAAIRFSQSLTKDNIFMGLRGLVHQIGEAAGREQVSIDFEIGRLVCSDRDMQFIFMAEIYAKEGLEVPEGALEATEYKPSVTYAPPSKDALSLSLQGQGKSLFSGSVKANSYGGWEDTELSPRSASTQDVQANGQEVIDTSDIADEEMGRHLAQVEALGRYIGRMEEDAAQAISEKHLWEGHLDRCNGLEQNDVEWRRKLELEHAEQLKLQIQQDLERHAKEKSDFKTTKNMHNFPCFTEPPAQDVKSQLKERRANLKKDLDHQIQTRNLMRKVQKDREKELEMVNVEAGQFEIHKIKKDEGGAKRQERAILVQAWDQDVRLKTVKKAIADHHRTPGPKAILSGLLSGLNGCETSPAPSPSPRLDTPGKQSSHKGPSPRLDTPGDLSPKSVRSSLASSRMPGSARRMPIGAAASLALQKEKLKTNAQSVR